MSLQNTSNILYHLWFNKDVPEKKIKRIKTKKVNRFFIIFVPTEHKSSTLFPFRDVTRDF
jgi:hypothetical protein